MLSLLEDWRWLVDASYSPFVVTSMGDMVLSNADGVDLILPFELREFWVQAVG